MDCIVGKIDYAQFLHGGSEVSFKEKSGLQLGCYHKYLLAADREAGCSDSGN